MDKNFFKSKSIWGAILILVGALYGYTTNDTVGGATVSTVGIGLLGIGLRLAED